MMMAGAAVTPSTVAAASPAGLAIAGPYVGPLAVSVLSVAGPLFFLALQTAGLKEMPKLNAAKSVGDRSPMPYTSLVACAFTWATFGYLTWDMSVMLPNLSATFFGLYYVYTFQKYADPAVMRKQYIVWGPLIATVIALFACGMPAQYIANIGAVVAIILMGSPLAGLKTILEQKDASSMPFAQCCAALCNGISWALYGYLVVHNPAIWFPNGVGALLSLFQLALFVIYPGKPKPKIK
jgi:solute carrier family 50 protein (sugar transporter)